MMKGPKGPFFVASDVIPDEAQRRSGIDVRMNLHVITCLVPVIPMDWGAELFGSGWPGQARP
jgi:hypothetical protein